MSWKKERKVTLVHGKPLRPARHLPYKAEEFIFDTPAAKRKDIEDFAATDLKSGATEVRISESASP